MRQKEGNEEGEMERRRGRNGMSSERCRSLFEEDMGAAQSQQTSKALH